MQFVQHNFYAPMKMLFDATMCSNEMYAVKVHLLFLGFYHFMRLYVT